LRSLAKTFRQHSGEALVVAIGPTNWQQLAFLLLAVRLTIAVLHRWSSGLVPGDRLPSRFGKPLKRLSVGQNQKSCNDRF
jgi:hypothetical protein